jgi:hypothetical protein
MTHDPKKRDKKLKEARLLLRWWPSLLLLMLLALGWSVHSCWVKPGIASVLRLLGPAGGLLLLAGWRQRARGTLGSGGEAPRSVLMFVGAVFVVGGPTMADMYRRGHWGVFYGTLGAVCLIVLFCGYIGYITWLEVQERGQKAG